MSKRSYAKFVLCRFSYQTFIVNWCFFSILIKSQSKCTIYMCLINLTSTISFRVSVEETLYLGLCPVRARAAMTPIFCDCMDGAPSVCDWGRDTYTCPKGSTRRNGRAMNTAFIFQKIFLFSQGKTSKFPHTNHIQTTKGPL